MGKIEFMEGESYCRWNGILMTNENYKKTFGISKEDEPIIEDKYIDTADVIYTDLCFGDLFKLMVEQCGKHYGPLEPYDPVLTKGAGFWEHAALEQCENSYVIEDRMLERFNGLSVKPMADFKKDFPNFDVDKWLEFMDDLDAFYDTREYNER